MTEAPAVEIVFERLIPVLRIFDIAKADEFYLGYLGFTLDWEHRFEPNTPVYRQVSRGGLLLQLSEHHGDGSPNARVRVMLRGVAALHAELAAKQYRYMRPGLERMPWGTLEFSVIDPFCNRISFCEAPAKE